MTRFPKDFGLSFLFQIVESVVTSMLILTIVLMADYVAKGGGM